MTEAFAKRLRQLYPEPLVTYSEGKKVSPPGLKPDIYVRHPDGRQWVFEMVHGNAHARHLLENHARYRDAGISDIWILWDDLRPGSRRKFSGDQGMMTTLLKEPSVYPLTRPQRAILEMQTSDPRYLYAFTVSPFEGAKNHITTAYLRMLMIGVGIYRFDGWSGETKYPATFDYVPMVELVFASDGTFVIPKEHRDEEIFEQFISQLGVDGIQDTIPVEFIKNIESLLKSPTAQREYFEALLRSRLERSSPEEQQELVAFVQSKTASQLQPFESQIPAGEIEALFSSADMMDKLVDDLMELTAYLAEIPLPVPLKQFILDIVNGGPSPGDIADLMRWQAESESLQLTRKEQ